MNLDSFKETIRQPTNCAHVSPIYHILLFFREISLLVRVHGFITENVLISVIICITVRDYWKPTLNITKSILSTYIKIRFLN